MNTPNAAEKPIELVVHIGDGKTGSSAIQKVLRREVGLLAENAVYYLGLMLEFAPVKKFDWQRDTRIEAFHALPKERAIAEMAEVLQGSVDIAREHGTTRLVLSNETLLRRSATMIGALRILDPTTVAVRPVVYVRRHDRWALSAYLQWGLRHKAYEGPIKSFAEWSRGTPFTVHGELKQWLDAFGPAVEVRNFDAAPDVVSDFLQLLGVTGSDSLPVRANESPPPEELALRALFNQQAASSSAPVRFNKLFHAADVDFRLSLGSWLREKLPTPSQLQDVADSCAEDRVAVNEALRACGQPPLLSGDAGFIAPQLDPEVLMSALFQMIAIQAQELEQLEKRMSSMSTPAGNKLAVEPGSPEGQEGLLVSAGILQVLAPGLGYFGANRTDNLQVEVGGTVRSLRLGLSEGTRTFLNLRKLEFLRNGKVFDVPDGGFAVSQSSVSGDEGRHGPANLLSGAGIHSEGELAPWWGITFDPPIQIDQLTLWNRSDGWGSRSRTLSIDATFDDGATRCLYRGNGARSLSRSLSAAAGHAPNVTLPPELPDSAAALQGLRRDLFAGIADRVRTQELAPGKVQWRELVPLLDVWGKLEEPGRDEWTLIAAFLLFQQQAKAGTSIRSFSLLLNSQSRLKRLQQEINQLARVLGLGMFMLTRHGLRPAGVLRTDPQRFLAHTQAVLDALSRMGRDPVLAYGTLLGAVRDGDFIAHDDDIDLLYRSRATSKAAVEAELSSIKEELRGYGFRVTDLLPNSLNMHVMDPRSGTDMDVFPCWEEGGLLQMHMEGMKIRGIDPAIVYPTGRIEFLGRTFPVPAQPEAYLEHRYGPGWRVSDQFFEWPWTIKEEVV
ncbi:MAG: LicD family protein [Pseudomonadota bacterium]|nr:LicD family protein [Pseudomonadota bacterium]